MARTTVDDCLTHVSNRYDLVLLASKRARQLAFGNAMTEIEDTETNEKSTVLSLREIGEGLVDYEQITKQEEVENPTQEVDFESILRGFEESDRELEAREEEKEKEERTQQSTAEDQGNKDTDTQL